jgi:hypothetical protein
VKLLSFEKVERRRLEEISTIIGQNQSQMLVLEDFNENNRSLLGVIS